ncbi:hypothetical protein KKG36_00795, partial [Patescibacteria group bacterium]|nr:hypothetical protein [Patescibacteria group bacterium]
TVKKLEKELQGLSEVQEQVAEVVSEQEAVSQQLEDISANQEQVIEQQEQLLEAQPGSVLNSLKNLWSGISPARLLGSLNNATQWLKDLFTF